MAADTGDDVTGAERFAQLAKAGFPFNPVGGSQIAGKNMDRLLASMKMFGWVDPRFVTQEQAQANGWSVGEQAKNVVVKVRGAAGLPFDDQLLFNASDVLGMPPLDAMLAMSDTEIAVMQGQAEEVEADDELTVGPARSREVESKSVLDVSSDVSMARLDLDKVQPHTEGMREIRVADAELAAAAAVPKVGEVGSEDKFGVMADYWQSGLHNSKGVALAREINKTIKAKGLEADKEAIARLLAVYPDARRMGINVVAEARLLTDLDLRVNAAEPRNLLNGALVRDKEGAYRPASGGLAVLVDKGDSLSLKGKGAQAYQAAMELALAKGWTSIELKGKPAMLANAWLEAKMIGLDVVNYSPTDKDKAAFAQRVAQESKAKAAADQARSAEVASEVVEVRPYFDAQGVTKTASVTAAVEVPAVRHVTLDGELGTGDVKQDRGSMMPLVPPPVVRTVARAGDIVRSEISTAKNVIGDHGDFVAGNSSSKMVGEPDLASFIDRLAKDAASTYLDKATSANDVAKGFESRHYLYSEVAVLARMDRGEEITGEKRTGDESGIITAEIAQQWAKLDARDLGKMAELNDGRLTQYAVSLVTGSAQNPDYLAAMQQVAPELVQHVMASIELSATREKSEEVSVNTPVQDMAKTAQIKSPEVEGRLVDHGPARFDHDPNAKMNYYAVVENSQGELKTTWGVDLDRSLAAAGAEVGDVVSLKRGELTPVDIDEKQQNGSIIPKTVNRVTWETELLSRAVEAAPPKMAVVSEGLNIGKILEIKDGFAKQQTGRDPVNDVKWHDVSKLNGPALEVGKMAEIQYSRGLGLVKGLQLERGGIGR